MYVHRTYIQMLSVILILAVMVTQTNAENGDTTEKPEAEVADSSDATADVDTEPENDVSKVTVSDEEIESATTETTIMTTMEEEPEASPTEEAEDLTTTPKSETSTKEEPAESNFRVLDSNDKTCVLAKFTITFHNEGKQKPLTTLPENAKSKGTCEEDKERSLHLSWHNFNFTMVFSKDLKGEESKNKWAVSSLELSSAEGKIAKSKEQKMFFDTPLGKSYSCQSPEVIKLIAKKGNVTVKFHDVKLQPFEVKDGVFSSAEECDTIAAPAPITEEPFVQDETVPLAVGLTLAILTLLVVLGFSIYRAYTLRKVDYNSME